MGISELLPNAAESGWPLPDETITHLDHGVKRTTSASFKR